VTAASSASALSKSLQPGFCSEANIWNRSGAMIRQLGWQVRWPRRPLEAGVPQSV
jgi:hypothetical protein